MISGIRQTILDAPPLVRDLAVALAVGLALVAARLVTMQWLMIPGVTRIAFLWPPTLFLLVALLLSPYRRWWLLVAASFIAALTTMGEAGLAMVMTAEAMNSAQALVAAGLLRLLAIGGRDLETVRGMVGYLAIAACIAPFAFSLASAGLLQAGGWIDDFGTNWRARGITNVVTAITLGPPLLLGLTRSRAWRRRAILEGSLLLGSIPLIELLVTNTATNLLGVATPLLYLPILYFIWAALRLGPAGVALAALTVLITRTNLGTPILVGIAAPPSDNLLTLQLFVIAMSTPFMVLAAILRDYRLASAEVRAGADRHRMAAAAGRVGVWDWNLVTDEVFVDPSLKALIGYADDEIDNVMSDWGHHVHPGDQPRIAARVDAHLERGEPFEVEHRMLHKDGDIVWFIARGSVVERDEEGRPTRMMGTDVDVTRRRHIEDAVQALRSGVDQSGKVEGFSTLAASVAHEVSQPVAAIVANAKACLRWLAAERPDLDEVRDAVRDILVAGGVAGGVIDRTRAMFWRRRLEHEPVAIGEVIRISTELLDRRLRRAEIEVTTDCPADLPDVLGDPVQLQQVLDNLMGNAIDAMSRSNAPRRIAIEARQFGAHVRLTVRDTGRGIDGKDLQHIFEPFYSTRSEGLGLGLAITHSIVEAHGGSIRAETAEGGGMCFEIVLPTAAVEAGAEA